MKTKSYEGMFLFDNSVAHDWPSMEQEVRRLCDRIGANVHVLLKFDERKLAYEINGRKRGTYVLTYFDAPADRLGDMERDARLSESILRTMLLRIEPLKPEKLAELKAHPVDVPLQPMSEHRREDRGDRFDGPPHGRPDRGPRRDEESPAGPEDDAGPTDR